MKRTKGGLKQLIGWCSIACIVFLLSSCSSKPENEIVGKWKEIGGTETLEFFKDGTISVIDKRMSLGGSYKFVGKDRIKFELGGLGALTGPIVEKVSFSGRELILTMPDGKVSKYSKFK
jgi:hypothetical protein